MSVSVGTDMDRLVCYVDVYQDKNMTQFKMVKDIPMQIASAEELQQLSSIADGIGNGSKTFFWVYVALNIFFSFALGMLWGTF